MVSMSAHAQPNAVVNRVTQARRGVLTASVILFYFIFLYCDVSCKPSKMVCYRHRTLRPFGRDHVLGIPVGSSWLPQAFPAPGVARKRGTTYRGRSAREPGGGAQHPAKPLLGKGHSTRGLMGSGSRA